MKKLIRQLASESVIYGLSGIITRFINVFLVPLYTRILMPEDYGVLNLVNTTFYFVGIFVIFALDNSTARWFYDTEEINERKKPIATWFWFQLFVSVIIAFIFILLSAPLSELIIGEQLPQLLIIPALTIVSAILPTIIWNWLRLRRKVWLTVSMSTGSVLLTIGLNVLFTLYFRMGVKGILLAALISNTIYSIVALFLMKGWLNFSFFSVGLLRQMLKYALPLLPTSIAFWVLNSSAAYFIKIFSTNAEVGLFSIGASVASAVGMIIGAFQMAWGPFSLSIMNKPEAKEVYALVLTLYTVVASLTALTVALFSKEVLMILTTPDYYSAYLVSGIMAFNAIIYGYAYIGGIGISIVKRTGPLAFAILMGSSLTLGLFFLLIPLMGKEGAAISTLIGYLIIPIYVFYKSQRAWYIPYRFQPTIILLVSAFVLFIVNTQLPTVSTGMTVLMKLVLLLIFLFIIVATLYFNYKQKIQSYLDNRKLRVGIFN